MRSQTTLGTALQRLSSGLRINSARDDAAGLAISERFTTQIRGTNQAVRNANDGISMLQTADGALTTVTQSLQRIRELAVQAANDSNSSSDRQALQLEVKQLSEEIDRVGRTTTFNGQQLFGQAKGSVVGNSNQLAVLDALQSGWLSGAESLVKQYYGIQAHGNAIRIQLTGFSDGAGGVLAAVSGSVGGSGIASNITLNVDMADFVPPNPQAAKASKTSRPILQRIRLARWIRHCRMLPAAPSPALPTSRHNSKRMALHSSLPS